MTKRPITLRAWKREILPPIPINQGDILSRTVIITLEDYNGKLIDLTGAAVRVHFTKPDAKIVYLSAEIVNPLLGCVSVTLDSQCVAVKGTVTAIVQVTGADGSNLYLTGLSFDIADIDIEGSIESTNEFTALTEALSTVQQYDGRIATNTADIAELQTDKADKSEVEDLDAKKANKTEIIPLSQKGAPGGVATTDSNGNLVQSLPVQVHYPTLLNGFVAYNNNPNYMPKITKQGNVVNIWALLSPPAGNTIGSNDTAMFEVPRDLAPLYHVITLTQGGQLNDVYRAWVRGLADPKPFISILNTKDTNPSAGSWIPINITYMI